MTAGFHKYLLLILLLITVAGLLMWTIGVRQFNQFRQDQQDLAEHSTAQASDAITNYLQELRRSVALFVEYNHNALARIVESPQDLNLRAKLDTVVLNHFPDAFAYTLADADGTVLLPDTSGLVGKDCRSEILSFARKPETPALRTRIHPDQYDFHFDVKARIHGGDHATRIFFISFKLDRLTGILRRMQAPGHHLYIVNESAGNQIELGESGARVQMHRGIRLSEQELVRQLSGAAVEQTQWHVIDVMGADSLLRERMRVTENMLLLFLLFIAGCLVFLLIIKHQDRRRAFAEHKLAEHQHDLEKLVRDRTAALEQANERLEHLSLSDGLTGIANRRHFDHVLARELRRAIRENEPLSLLLLDIDHFKRYNDAVGHLAGDEALKKIARTIEGVFMRGADLAARYGGEEFAVILPGTGTAEAMEQAERVREAVESLNIDHPDTDVSSRVTVSVGVSSLRVDQYRTAEDLIDAADSALYLAKSRGRNQSVSEDGQESPNALN